MHLSFIHFQGDSPCLACQYIKRRRLKGHRIASGVRLYPIFIFLVWVQHFVRVKSFLVYLTTSYNRLTSYTS